MLSTETLGCTTGMRFPSMNSAPSCAFDDGVSHSTPALDKVVFIAEILPNRLIISIPNAGVD